MVAIVSAATQSRFAETDAQSDEVVISEILQVYEACISGSWRHLLTDSSTLVLFEACNQIKSQLRHSKLLRRTAERVMNQILKQSLFSILSRVRNGEPLDDLSMESVDQVIEKLHESRTSAGLPSLVKMFASLFSSAAGSLVQEDPLTRSWHNLTWCLNLINECLEMAGSDANRLGLLTKLFFDDLCFLLLKTAEADDLVVQCCTQKLLHTLIVACHLTYRVHWEVLISFIYLRGLTDPNASLVKIEMLLEGLRDLAAKSDLFPRLFYNCDCRLEGTPLCFSLCQVVCQLCASNIFESREWIQVLALDVLTTAWNGILTAFQDAANNEAQSAGGESDQMSVQFSILRKREYGLAIEAFNQKPSKGLQILKDKVIQKPSSDSWAEDFARFLRQSTSLDMVKVGEVLGKHDSDSKDILQEFVKLFDFRELTLDSAVRMFLGSFRLPGEAQQIDRIINAFATQYFEDNKNHGILSNPDAVYVLSFSVIMLQTDLHNPFIKQKMSVEDFIRSNRGINNNADLPADYLTVLYNNIAAEPIQTNPDRSFTGVWHLYRWKDICRRAEKEGNTLPLPQPLHSTDLFPQMVMTLTPSMLSAISSVLERSSQLSLLDLSLDAMLLLANLCSHAHVYDLLDQVVSVLYARSFGVSGSSLVLFASQLKIQLIAMAFFGVAKQHGDAIRSGWRSVVAALAQVALWGLLRDGLQENQDLIQHRRKHSALNNNTKGIAKQGSMSRFLQKVSNYLSFYDEPEEEHRGHEPSAMANQRLQGEQQSPQYVEAHAKATECVQALRLPELIAETKFLGSHALEWIVQALVEEVQSEFNSEERSVWILWLLMEVVLRNRDRVHVTWPIVRYPLMNFLRPPTGEDNGFNVENAPWLLQSTVVFLFRLSLRVLHRDEIRDELIQCLTSLLLLDITPYLDLIAESISQLVQSNAEEIRSVAGWVTILQLLERTASSIESSAIGFDALAWIVDHRQLSLVADENQSHVEALLRALRTYAVTPCAADPQRNFKAVDLISNVHQWYLSSMHLNQVMDESVRKTNEPKLVHYDSAASSSSVDSLTATFELVQNSNHTVGSTFKADGTSKDWWFVLDSLKVVVLDIADVRDQHAAKLRQEALQSQSSRHHSNPAVGSGVGSSFGIDEELQYHALIALQRGLLDSSLKDVVNAISWFACFNTVVLKVISKLPEKQSVSDRTLVMAVNLLSKVFLLQMTFSQDLPADDFHKMWLRVLRTILSYIHLGQTRKSDLLAETAIECLKNLLRVMVMSGELTPLSAADIPPSPIPISASSALSSLPVFSLFTSKHIPPPPPPSADRINTEWIQLTWQAVEPFCGELQSELQEELRLNELAKAGSSDIVLPSEQQQLPEVTVTTTAPTSAEDGQTHAADTEPAQTTQEA
eukprot:GILJ01014880.1.p1 GENE.GILJ01014880.1~~GILJ01014880.1.p1  ORF type:complete len:1497 (-),score=271.69 GILJ01014880.1:37-4212(-)